MRWLEHRLNGWVILGSVLIAGVLIVITAMSFFLLPNPLINSPDQAQAITIIPAPTMTSTPTRVVETPTATPQPSIGGISVGSYVQITGTGGQGLRLRSGPGTDNPPRFLGMDAEVFMVKDGPQHSDEFIWWFLEAPYDADRSGWAAADYLNVIDPTITP